MLGAAGKENCSTVTTEHISIYYTKIIPIIYLNQNVMEDKILKTGEVRNYQNPGVPLPLLVQEKWWARDDGDGSNESS